MVFLAIYRVPVAELGAWIARVSPHIRNMAESSGGRFIGEDILDALYRDRMQLWVIQDGGEHIATCITEIIEYPRLKAIRIIAAVGTHAQRWAHLHEAAWDWGKTQGCTKFEALTRPGWQRLLAPFRFRLFHTLLEKSA